MAGASPPPAHGGHHARCANTPHWFSAVGMSGIVRGSPAALTHAAAGAHKPSIHSPYPVTYAAEEEAKALAAEQALHVHAEAEDALQKAAELEEAKEQARADRLARKRALKAEAAAPPARPPRANAEPPATVSRAADVGAAWTGSS